MIMMMVATTVLKLVERRREKKTQAATVRCYVYALHLLSLSAHQCTDLKEKSWILIVRVHTQYTNTNKFFQADARENVQLWQVLAYAKQR